MTATEIDNLKAGEIHRLHEIYRQECKARGVKASLSDFHVWLQER